MPKRDAEHEAWLDQIVSLQEARPCVVSPSTHCATKASAGGSN